MNDDKRNLQGSDRRDIFKRVHKTLSRRFYACDLDFVWAEKSPPGIVAFVDYKHPSDGVTFSEVLVYNTLLKIAPVYIIESPNPELGPFKVLSYLGGDWRPEPPMVHTELARTCPTWAALEQFEQEIRDRYRSRKLAA